MNTDVNSVVVFLSTAVSESECRMQWSDEEYDWNSCWQWVISGLLFMLRSQRCDPCYWYTCDDCNYKERNGNLSLEQSRM